LLKRLVGVITVRENWAVQSIGYNRYLPLGRPEVIAENFDSWQLDEILVVDIDQSKRGAGPNFDLLKKISDQKIMTPICYMGGVRGVDDALQLIKSGADRIAIDSLYRTDLDAAYSIAGAIGRQAVVRVQPLIYQSGNLHCYDHLAKASSGKIILEELAATAQSFSELMIVDVMNEGKPNSFTEEMLSAFDHQKMQLICFGGISTKSQVSRLFTYENVSAVAIGNSLSYREIANRSVHVQTETDVARSTSFGARTDGAKEW
jgi:cyclase